VWLLGAGADAEALNASDSTPLHSAVANAQVSGAAVKNQPACLTYILSTRGGRDLRAVLKSRSRETALSKTRRDDSFIVQVAVTVALVLLGGSASLTARTDDSGETAAAVARRRSPAAHAALAAAAAALPVAQGSVGVEACSAVQQRALMALVRHPHPHPHPNPTLCPSPNRSLP